VTVITMMIIIDGYQHNWLWEWKS